MVFEGYQDGYNGSHIIYSNGTGIALKDIKMATMVVILYIPMEQV